MQIARIWRIMLIAVSLLLIGIGTAHAAPPPGSAQQVPAQQDPTPPPVYATVAVERAIVFAVPDRTTDPLTYLYQRERAPVYGQSADGSFLFVPVGNLWGWILTAQVDIEGDLAMVQIVTQTDPLATPTLTITPFQASPVPTMNSVFPTRTPLPTQTPPAGNSANGAGGDTNSGSTTGSASGSTSGDDDAMPLLPGVPPPVAITIPDNWDVVNLVVPFRTFDGQLHDAPLSIYFGELAPGVNGFIYLYWGFPNTVDYIDYISGEYTYNLWSDGVQLLRGSLLGETCNIGLYDQQTYLVGGVEGIGAPYQAADCEGEADTAGWFSVMRVQDGTFAFYTAVEPWEARADYRDTLQAMLDSVVFFPPDKPEN